MSLGRNQLEARLGHRQELTRPGTAVAVLLDLEDPAAREVRVLHLNRQGDEGVDHVLERVGAHELAALGDLADHDRIDEVLLRIVGDLGEDTLRGLAVGGPAGVVTVVHALEGVDDDDEGSTGVLRPQLRALAEEGGHVDLVGGDEAPLQLEALRRHPELVEGLLAGVVDHDRAVAGQGVGQREHHRRLARTRAAREHGHGARSEPLPTEGVVPELQAGAELTLHGIGNADVDELGSPGELVIDLDLHQASFPLMGFRCWAPPLYIAITFAHVIFDLIPVNRAARLKVAEETLGDVEGIRLHDLRLDAWDED